MSTVQTVAQVILGRPSGVEPSITQLEDALYDILATGLDPGAAPHTLEAVQVFLHEHARKKKSYAELLAFFDRHGLSLTTERVSPLLPRTMELPDMPGPASHDPSPARGGVTPPVVPASSASGRARWGWALLACAMLVALGAAVGMGYSTLTQLRVELARVHSEAEASATALDQVKREAETLRAGLQQNSELVRRVDAKSELLLTTLASPLDPEAR